MLDFDAKKSFHEQMKKNLQTQNAHTVHAITLQKNH